MAFVLNNPNRTLQESSDLSIQKYKLSLKESVITPLKVFFSSVFPLSVLYLLLYFSHSYHVHIISEGWKEFWKVGEVS